MAARSLALLVFCAFASIGLLGCGGADCEAIKKESDDAAAQLGTCTGKTGEEEKKCSCDAYAAIIAAAQKSIDGECYAEGENTVTKEQAEEGLKIVKDLRDGRECDAAFTATAV